MPHAADPMTCTCVHTGNAQCPMHHPAKPKPAASAATPPIPTRPQSSRCSARLAVLAARRRSARASLNHQITQSPNHQIRQRRRPSRRPSSSRVSTSLSVRPPSGGLPAKAGRYTVFILARCVHATGGRVCLCFAAQCPCVRAGDHQLGQRQRTRDRSAGRRRPRRAGHRQADGDERPGGDRHGPRGPVPVSLSAESGRTKSPCTCRASPTRDARADADRRLGVRSADSAVARGRRRRASP